ncbi:MAG: chromosomal replication initiator protein DnaA [Verrucomicrobiales bacterium]|nr:chromosomal replication initiator protein DnaA [Verrucomicrobiales bacterium]
MQSHETFHEDQPADRQDLEKTWNHIARDLRVELGVGTFDLWFGDFSIVSYEGELVTLGAPGSMYAIWVEENFKICLLSILPNYFPKCKRIAFEVGTAEDTTALPKSLEKPEEPVVVKKKVLSEKVSEKKLLERGRKAGLVEIFRFDNFVPGENSELAWAAAQAVAAEPGKTYQPLFFHSSCGLGKTHLLHGIGWESLRLRPKSKIIFVTAEHFANDYIDAIQKNSLVPFRKKYREADLLLIDDVQFLGRKEGLQREFFHTFNQLADQQKQIVLASDCPPSEINELEDRLVSRFQWGLSTEIHRPGLMTRAAILRSKRDEWGMNVSDEVINAIVERVRGNVRVLEGALIRVAMVATMNEEPLEVSAVPEILSDICGDSEESNVGIEEIKKAVAEHYDLEVAVLNGKRRTARVAEARQVAMYLIRTMTDFSLVEIASSFGKDHGTVIYAVKKVKSKCETSSSLKSTVELIRRRLLRGDSNRSADRSRTVSQSGKGPMEKGNRESGQSLKKDGTKRSAS